MLVTTAAVLSRQVRNGCVHPCDVVRTFEFQSLPYAAEQPVLSRLAHIDPWPTSAMFTGPAHDLVGPAPATDRDHVLTLEAAPDHDDGKR